MHSTLSQLAASSPFYKCHNEALEGSVLAGGLTGHMVGKKGISLTTDL